MERFQRNWSREQRIFITNTQGFTWKIKNTIPQRESVLESGFRDSSQHWCCQMTSFKDISTGNHTCGKSNYRSGCLRIGAYSVLRKIISDYRLDLMLARIVGKDAGSFLILQHIQSLQRIMQDNTIRIMLITIHSWQKMYFHLRTVAISELPRN